MNYLYSSAPNAACDDSNSDIFEITSATIVYVIRANIKFKREFSYNFNTETIPYLLLIPSFHAATKFFARFDDASFESTYGSSNAVSTF